MPNWKLPRKFLIFVKNIYFSWKSAIDLKGQNYMTVKWFMKE